MSNYNDDIHKKMSDEIMKLNQQYIDHIKKIEDGYRGRDFGGNHSSGVSEYKKNSYEGGRLMNRATAHDAAKALPEQKKIQIIQPPVETQQFQLPHEEQEQPTRGRQQVGQPQEDEGWFHKAKKWVGDFFGGRKPTKKEREEIEKIFKARGHDISSKSGLKGGFKLGDLGNSDFWNSINVSGGKKPKGLKGGFKLGDLGNSDFWNGITISGGKKPKSLNGGNWIDDIGDFFTNTVANGIKDGVTTVANGVQSIGLGKKGKIVRATKGKGKPNVRALIVKRIMHEKGLNLPQASKYVKDHNLYVK